MSNPEERVRRREIVADAALWAIYQRDRHHGEINAALYRASDWQGTACMVITND